MNSRVIFLLLIFITCMIHPASSVVYTGVHWDTAASGNSDPQGITMNSSYFWIVDDADDEVYKYHHNGTYTGTSWDTNAIGSFFPYGITMDSSYFWVTDYWTKEVYKYHHNGTYTGTSWDTAASGNSAPRGITMDSSYFWILDGSDVKVYKYHHNGTYTGTSWDTLVAISSYERQGITMDSSYFWILDGSYNKVYKYHHNGTYTGTSWDTTVGQPYNDVGITMDFSHFWVVNLYNDEVFQYAYNSTLPFLFTDLGDNLIDHTPTITWTKGIDGDGDTVTTYIYVGTNSTPTDIEGWTTGETYDLGTNITLIDGDTYYYRLRGYSGTSYSDYTTADEFRMNSIIIPTIISPINKSCVLSHPVTLEVNSTDAEGDSLTYYFYGDTTDGTTLINISTTGNYTWNIEDYDTYYWKARAYNSYEYSANTSLQQFTLLAPPDLQTPTNASTHTYSFPPLLHDLTFAWQDTNAPAYKYQVATDDDFNLISEEDTITSNTTALSLEADDYYWRVYAYETSTGTYSNASDVWQFTINETNGDGAVTAIDGVVYEVTAAGSVAVDGALVNVWNSTWSDSMLVGQNGYYYFDGAKDGTYSVRATKTGYTDSSIELVTVQALNTTTRNILLQSTSGAGQQYVDHYVKFIVKSLISTLYSDVEVNVYLGDAVIPQYTGTTGTDGSVAFELNEYQEYRITFEKTSPSIEKEITIYPKDDSYTVYVDIGTMIDDLLNPDDEDQAITAIDVSVTKTIINDNTANITVNYNDIMDETSGLTLTLSQSIAGNTTNKTILSTVDLGTTNNTAYNFTVTNYNGESYLIEIEATHTTHGAIYRMYGIQFENTDTLFGFTVEVVGWLAIIFLTWFALTATSITVQHTAIGVCALATAMIAIGWGSYISMSGLGLAWIMSLAANFAHAKEASA